MNPTPALIKKYEALISELKGMNKANDDVIEAQERQINSLNKLVEAQNDKIELLMSQLEETMALSRRMAEILDSLEIDKPEDL